MSGPTRGATRGAFTAWARAAVADGASAELVLATAAAHLGGPDFCLGDRVVEPADGPAPDDAPAGVDLGEVYEAVMASDERRSRGAFYTPRSVAEGLVAEAVGGSPVVDPACGAGAFLLAAGERLVDTGVATPEQAVTGLLFGADTDPVAVAVARWSLARWAGVGPREVGGVVVGDPLASAPGLWEEAPAAGFGAVVGNPPFLGQLRRSTAYGREQRDQLRSRFGGLVGAYTDVAWLFAALGVDLLAPGGRLALIQPQSLLAARDAAPVRDRLLSTGRLAALWFDRSCVFSGRTHVCAPVVERTSSTGSVRLLADGEVRQAGTADPPEPGSAWGGLVAGLVGIPEVPERASGAGVVGDVAAVTAGFRQHYYALVPATRELGQATGGERPLVTTGLVDPLRCEWSRLPARFAGRDWEAPVVDVAAVAGEDPKVAAWLEERRRPKLLVASQTRVVEVVADEVGELVPLTPVIVVEPDEERLWDLAAAISSPPVAAHAARLTLGTARAPDRIKLAAVQVADLPLPADGAAWSEGAEMARRLSDASGGADEASWLAFGAVMCEAYRLPAEPLLAWWWDRHPASGSSPAGRELAGRGSGSPTLS